MVGTKQARFQNNGHEELSIEDIIKMGKITPTNIIVKHNSQKYVPRKMHNYFIPEINTYARKKDSLLTCVVIEKNNKTCYVEKYIVRAI